MLSFLLAALCMSAALMPAADHGRSVVETGWEEGFSSGGSWRPEPWLVHDPDDRPSAEFRERGGSLFRVAPGKAMAWTRTACPIWVEAFPWLSIDYTLDGQGARAAILLSDDSTGPITPGALNPENPLASGGQIKIELSPHEGHHLVNLTGLYTSDRVARISVLLYGSRSPASLRLGRMRFRAADPRSTSTTPVPAVWATWPPPLSPVTSRPAEGEWLPVTFATGQPVDLNWLSRALELRCSWSGEAMFEQGGAWFWLGSADQAAAATSVMATGSLRMDGAWRGRELALLLATRLFGTGSPWPGAGTVRSRGLIVSPHELVVHLHYDDGSRRSAMPWSLVRQEASVRAAPEAYVVPLDPDHTLTRIEIEERMTAGQVFLLAASIRPPDRPVLHLADAVPQHLPSSRPAPAVSETVMRMEGSTLTVRNAWLCLDVELQAGPSLRRLAIVPLQREVVALCAVPAAMLEVRNDKGHAMALTHREGCVSRQAGATVAELGWSADDAIGRIEVNLRLEAADDGRLRLTPGLSNPATHDRTVSVHCPRLAGCRIAARPEDRWYLLGTRSTVLDNRAVRVDQLYGGAFPLQLMDVFSPAEGGGLGLRVEDISLVSRKFHFAQDDGGAALSVEYSRTLVPARGRVTLPSTVLFGHLGDWHDAYHAYRGSIRALVENRRAGGFQELFYCRRDYPLGGTGYLFDVRSGSYTMQVLIDESSRCFGGVDMIDISGWAYHEKTGRVGDYRTNDLGGLAALREAVDAAHRRGVKVGLYFEGYLVDRRAPLAASALPAWQILDSGGKPMWWPGEMEFYVCPGVAAWRQGLSEAVADVVAETGADAVYVDEFGFCDAAKACWSADHGHAVPSNPLIEEQAMLAAIRAALDRRARRTAIYIEQLPCDATMGSVDGAFDYGMSGDDSTRHVARLPLSRFVFPEVVPIEMVSQGIRPVPVTEDDLHRCMFHGLGFWLKGRGDSWYAPGFLETARRARRILREHAATFRSLDCEPLVPTLVEGLYANRFTGSSETIMAVYNGRHTDIKGDLLRLPGPVQVRSLWSGQSFVHPEGGGAWVLRGQVAPRSVEVFLLSR